MKILQLTKKFPYPIKDGETLAILALSTELDRLGAEVSLLAMNTVKHFYAEDQLPEKLGHYQSIDAIKVDNRIKLTDALLNLFSPTSYHIERFYSEAYNEKLIELLNQSDFDIIQLETLYLACYIPTIRQHSSAVIAMRAHNVEQEIWDRISQHTNNWFKQRYLIYLTQKLKKFEDSQLKEYDLLLAITQRDLEFFRKRGFKGEGLSIPIGINVVQYQPDFSSYEHPISISFIGSLDWMPNIEGLQWFLESVWSTYNKPIKLHIAGRNCPQWLYKWESKHTLIHGEVPNAKTFINQHSVMIVPLRSGSGMRAKILEGMALGKVVITTSIGLEGIEAEPGRDVLIANTPQEFQKQLDYCNQESNTLKSIGQRARDLVKSKYNSQKIASTLLDTYEQCIRV